MKVTIVGAAGYTGGMLIRLLLQHPMVAAAHISAVSRTHFGKDIEAVHSDLVGRGLVFVESLPELNDVIFLCLPHGESKQWLSKHDVGDAVVIDLGNDHRLDEAWVYGLPEINRDIIASAKRIANPGCFATCIELALLRLAEHQQLNKHVVVSAVTGSTGAGQSPSATTHYSYRANNHSVYKAFTHQHLPEIQNVLGVAPVFIPQRGAFTRGILAVCVVESNAPAAMVREHYRDRFADHPFVYVTDDLPDVKQAVGTNNMVVGIESHDGNVLVVGALDNLIKGASGQAIQNMNIACGFDETAGLLLPGLAL